MKMPIRAHFLSSQTKYGFWYASGFDSGSMHARLQVSICIACDLFHPSQHPGTQSRLTHPHTETAF